MDKYLREKEDVLPAIHHPHVLEIWRQRPHTIHNERMAERESEAGVSLQFEQGGPLFGVGDRVVDEGLKGAQDVPIPG